MQNAELEVQQNETTLAPEKYEPPVNIPMQNAIVEESHGKPNTVTGIISRGKQMVKMATNGKRKSEEEEAYLSNKIAKRKSRGKKLVIATAKQSEKNNCHHFKEIERSLLAIDTSEKIGSGTFGNCYQGIYREKFSVVCKKIKTQDSSLKELERAKQEVLHEAAVIADIGDHAGVPHLFGVCTDQAPFYLVLQYHTVENSSVTLLMAASTGIIANDEQCAIIMKETCEALAHLHSRGYLHNDLKGNNVVLDGEKHRPIIIDFGKSVKISKAKLRKPKLNVKKATKRYPHIAPELHRGERQSTASDVYSFGALINRVLEKGKFEMHALQKIAKACLSTNPGKRPGLDEVL